MRYRGPTAFTAARIAPIPIHKRAYSGGGGNSSGNAGGVSMSGGSGSVSGGRVGIGSGSVGGRSGGVFGSIRFGLVGGCVAICKSHQRCLIGGAKVLTRQSCR